MNKEKVEQFLKQYDKGEIHISTEIAETHGTMMTLSTPTIRQVLSDMVSCMDFDNEIYLEAGIAQGGTLTGAMINNPLAKAIAVDNWSGHYNTNDFLEATNIVMKNIRQCRLNTDNVEIVSCDYELFISAASIPKVGVFFYDASHDEEPTFRALEKTLPLLSDYAVVLVDDINWYEPLNAVSRFKKLTGAHGLMFTSPGNGDPIWWNGLSILIVNKKENDEHQAS